MENKIRDFVQKILNSGVDIIAFGEMQEHGFHESFFRELSQITNIFNGIFIEEPVEYQSSVDNYLQTGKLDEMFEGMIAGSLKEGKDIRGTIKAIFDSARKNSLPVICVDSSKIQNKIYTTRSKYGYYFLKGESRDEDMFNNILDIVNKKYEKWYFVGGSAHVRYGTLNGTATLGSLLKENMGNKFYNIDVWRDPDIQEEKVFDTRNSSGDGLREMEKKYSFSYHDKNGSPLCDGVIIHN